MRTKTWNVVGLCVLTMAFLGMLVQANGQNQPRIGRVAPAFSLPGSDGKTHTLTSLTAKGPVVFYFIGHDCPVNEDAVVHYNRLAKAYEGRVQFIGIMNGDAKTYAGWQGRHKAPYTVLFDPKLETISKFGVERSPWVVVVGKDRKTAFEKLGYSVPDLNNLNAEMAKLAGRPAAKVEFAGAPRSTRYG